MGVVSRVVEEGTERSVAVAVTGRREGFCNLVGILVEEEAKEEAEDAGARL